MLVHTVFDLLAWTVAALAARAIGAIDFAPKRTPFTAPYYFIALSLGALAGAVFIGSANLRFSGMFSLGHSIAGALAGGIVAVEIYKWAAGIRGSTGAQFAAPLAAGIAIGRVGCFLAGLPDYTYGVETTLPWGTDFGDGIFRHPVQLYESAAMTAFLMIYLAAVFRGAAFARRNGFYLFVLWYGVQRFAWEFLKPYPLLIGPFNLFHLLCAAMILYAIAMIEHDRDSRQTL
jgi:prolipoprotein diacylglyceryltransferase